MAHPPPSPPRYPPAPSKRAAPTPVSASAFSFALSTPTAASKKPRLDRQPPSFLSPAGRGSSTVASTSGLSDSTPKRTSRSHDPPGPSSSSHPPLPFTSRSNTEPESSSSSTHPRQPPPDRTPAKTPSSRASTPITSHSSTETPRRASIRVTDMVPLSLRTPITDRHPSITGATGRPQQRLHSVLQEVSPFLVGKKPARSEVSPRNDMQALSAVKFEVEIKEKKRVMEEDEGIGVSPRKNKVASRHGQPSQSAHLQSLISSSNLSLLLFYTSLRNTLYPSTNHPVSPAHHARTASLFVRILSPIEGPTHYSLMFRCSIVGSKPDLIGSTGQGEEREMMIVVFQPLPTGADRLGLDPRVAREGSKSCDAGIWAPMSEAAIPILSDNGGGHDQTRVLFATRYLIVEST